MSFAVPAKEDFDLLKEAIQLFHIGIPSVSSPRRVGIL
jgi:hypothetical protein